MLDDRLNSKLDPRCFSSFEFQEFSIEFQDTQLFSRILRDFKKMINFSKT